MRITPIVAAALLAGGALAGCSAAVVNSSQPTVAASHPGPTGSQSDTTETPSPQTPGSPSPVPKVNIGLIVGRPGALPADKRIQPLAMSGKNVVRYGDGLMVNLLSMTHTTTTGQGPGSLPGKPMTTFKIQFTNHTKKAIVLNQVVVAALYGTPMMAAAPVYDPGLSDFATTLRAGGTASTSYAFSIPTEYLGAVSLTVDFDGQHTAAAFSGQSPA